ncbi:flagellar hook capping FlgD N-terminal domain-containing protein [Cryptosporangium minutisporangium]|uniref:flagellar hook capping FlgD N-terminal domain-containing protein n=1 Tax=Cryptosporangium minutisporangium TaxID=113569 RepID=UPI0035EA3EE0
MTAPLGGTANTSAALNQALGAAPSKPPSAELDKDAFLKLLVAQLKYQDPMNPAQGTEFVSQTAQFTTVEKLTDLADVQQQMLTAQLTLGAANLVGKEVTYNDANGTPVTGTVSGATIGTNPSVTVNGLSIPMSSVTGIGKVGDTATAPAGGTDQGGFTPIGEAVPGATTPGATGPGAALPGTTAPGTTTPGTTAPGTTAPGTTAPGTTTPGTATPGTAAPGTTAPDSMTNTGTGVTTGSPSPTVQSPTTPPGPITSGTAPDATTPGA